MSESRAGFVALVGAPNAGKSSLLNQLLRQKLSVVTPVAQTTRQQVVGIDTRDGVQMVFVDTPGLLEPHHLFHRSMVASAVTAMRDADVIALVLDASAARPALSLDISQTLRDAGGKLVVVLNKTDLAQAAALKAAQTWAEQQFNSAVLAVSARTGEGVAQLRGALESRLPESPFLFPADEVATQSMRFFVSELIRESVLELYAREIPHSVAVMIEEFREVSQPVYIRSTIFVERASQKKIIIGANGEAIKRLGMHSRRKVEQLVGSPTFLDLWVKVLPNWRRKADLLRRVGYQLPSDAE